MPWITQTDFVGSRNSQFSCATNAASRADVLWETDYGPYSYNGTSWVDGGTAYYGVSASGGKGACGAYSSALVAGGWGTTQSTTSCLFDGTSYTGGPSLTTNMRFTQGCGTPSSGFWTYNYASTGESTTSQYFNGTSWASKTAFFGGTPGHRGSMAGTYDACIAAGGYAGFSGSQTVQDTAKTWNGTSWTTISTLTTALYRQSGFGTQDSFWSCAGYDSSNAVHDDNQYWNGTSWGTDSVVPDARRDAGGSGPGQGGWVIAGYLTGGAVAYPTYEWTFSRTVTCTSGAVEVVGAGLVLQQPGRAHILSVTPDSFGDGTTGIVIATQHITTTGAKVYIAGVEQTVTGTTADSITFTASKGDASQEDGPYTLVVIEGP